MADLITDAELLQLGAAGNALNGVSSSDRAAIISAASSFVLSRLQKRFALPLVSWSDDVRRATAHVAAWDAIVFRGFNPNATNDQIIKLRADKARQWLADVVAGSVEPENVVDATSTYDENGPIMASDEPAGWVYPRPEDPYETEGL